MIIIVLNPITHYNVDNVIIFFSNLKKSFVPQNQKPFLHPTTLKEAWGPRLQTQPYSYPQVCRTYCLELPLPPRAGEMQTE